MKETTKPMTANKNKYTKKAANDSAQLAVAKPEEPSSLTNSGFGQMAVSLLTSLLFSTQTPSCKD